MKDCTPSFASSLFIRRFCVGPNAATHASKPSTTKRRDDAFVSCTASGASSAICSAISIARSSWLPAGTTSWTRPIRYASAASNSSAGQQVVHRVAPAPALDEADRGAAGRVDRALRLELREAAVVGGDHDVAGERELDAEREGDAVDRGDDRLAARAPEAHRVECLASRAARAFLHAPGPLREVETGREVVPVAEDHPAAQRVLLVEAGHRLDELLRHRRRVAVVLRRAVQPDQQQVAALLDADRAFVSGHRSSLLIRWARAR